MRFNTVTYFRAGASRFAPIWLLALAMLNLAGSPTRAFSQKEMKREVGVNLAGAEFPPRPGIYGKDYMYPNRAELAYYKSKGMRLFRIPFSWERMQRVLGAPLDPEELSRMDELVGGAHALHLKLILDVHGYDRRERKLIGADPVLENAFADLWRRLAEHYRTENAIYGYGLMNEPHDTEGTWPHTAQAAINAVRTIDRRHFILLAGDHWSGANTWESANPKILEVWDPENKLIYEAHIYFDSDGSGVYRTSYDDNRAYPEIGVDRVRPFIEWIRLHHARGLIGEFGVPNNDPRWNEVLGRLLRYLRDNQVSGTYWAGGPAWHHYILSCEPTAGKDAAQMQVLSGYTRHGLHRWISFRHQN